MTDLISRQAAIDYVRTEMCSGAWCGVLEALKRVPSAQPTQPNTPNTLESLDCISRQAAIDGGMTNDSVTTW